MGSEGAFCLLPPADRALPTANSAEGETGSWRRSGAREGAIKAVDEPKRKGHPKVAWEKNRLRRVS
jgi:hypothetical protein